MTELRILSPLKGWAAPLDEVPDPVFAERMMGDGVAVDPTEGALHAPCDGVVISVHRARHALTIRADNGAEILLHVGLETVALDGEGFTAHVADGQTVKAGELLISFDLDLLAQRAKSLITPVVLAGEGFAVTARTEGRAVEVGDELMRIERTVATPWSRRRAREARSAAQVVVPLPHGLHARPAARLARAAAGFAADVEISAHGRSANARSAVALMALGAGHGDEITIRARGADAEAAADALADLIAGGLGEAADRGAGRHGAAAFDRDRRARNHPRRDARRPAWRSGRRSACAPPVVDPPSDGEGVAAETAALAHAHRGRARRGSRPPRRAGSRSRRGILDAHLAMLDDPELAAEARGQHRARAAAPASPGAPPSGGTSRPCEALGPGRMAERAADLVDLERQVLIELCGEASRPARPARRAPSSSPRSCCPPSCRRLDPGRLAGFVTAARRADLARGHHRRRHGHPRPGRRRPGRARRSPTAPRLILDADARPAADIADPPPSSPTAEDEMAAHLAAPRRRARRRRGRGAAPPTGRGSRSSPTSASVEEAQRRSAERRRGLRPAAHRVPVPRPRRSRPDEDEQRAAYQAIADALGGRPLVVRTLDIGGGQARRPTCRCRTRRTRRSACAACASACGGPTCCATQLRAILRVSRPGPCQHHAAHGRRRRRAAGRARHPRRGARRAGHRTAIELGATIETPAAAITADLIAAEADFLSIGTNDLTQYALAMDRGHPALAAQPDALQSRRAAPDRRRRRRARPAAAAGSASAAAWRPTSPPSRS